MSAMYLTQSNIRCRCFKYLLLMLLFIVNRFITGKVLRGHTLVNLCKRIAKIRHDLDNTNDGTDPKRTYSQISFETEILHCSLYRVHYYLQR